MRFSYYKSANDSSTSSSSFSSALETEDLSLTSLNAAVINIPGDKSFSTSCLVEFSSVHSNPLAKNLSYKAFSLHSQNPGDSWIWQDKHSIAGNSKKRKSPVQSREQNFNGNSTSDNDLLDEKTHYTEIFSETPRLSLNGSHSIHAKDSKMHIYSLKSWECYSLSSFSSFTPSSSTFNDMLCYRSPPMPVLNSCASEASVNKPNPENAKQKPKILSYNQALQTAYGAYSSNFSPKHSISNPLSSKPEKVSYKNAVSACFKSLKKGESKASSNISASSNKISKDMSTPGIYSFHFSK